MAFFLKFDFLGVILLVTLAVYSIKGCRLLAGKLPVRATRLIREWAKIHEKELMVDWNIAQKEGKLKTIEPLS